MNLVLFLQVQAGWFGPREIVQVWESDGTSDHRLVYERRQMDLGASRLVEGRRFDGARQALDRVLASGTRSIREVAALLAAQAGPRRTAR